MGLSEIIFWQANVANLPNWPWPMKESRNMIGGLLGHVCQHDLFKYMTCQMYDLKSSKGWTVMFFHSWTQIVQVPIFRQISLICQKNFGKPKLALILFVKKT